MKAPIISPNTAAAIRNFAKAGLLPADEVDAALRHLGAIDAGTPECLLTVKTAAQRLGCCTRTILRLCDEGRLNRVFLRPGVRKTLRVRASEIGRILEGAAVAHEGGR